MPLVSIANVGTTIDWPPASAGRVRIRTKLHIPQGETFTTVPVELSFKRDPFLKLLRESSFWYDVRTILARLEDRWPMTEEVLSSHLRQWVKDEDALAAMLSAMPQYYQSCARGELSMVQSYPPDKLLQRWGDALCIVIHDSLGTLDGEPFEFWGVPSFKLRSRKRRQLLDGQFGGIDYRLTIDREDLKTLQACFASPQRMSRLAFEVKFLLFPTDLIDYALRGLPRGHVHALARRPLMQVIQCALFAAEELIRQANDDSSLRTSLDRVLAQEDYGRNISEAMQVTYLAERVLRPALQECGLQNLTGRPLSDFLDKTSREYFAGLFAALPMQRTEWFELLLGPEGGAAERLKLAN